jgi:hypothetical protein
MYNIYWHGQHACDALECYLCLMIYEQMFLAYMQIPMWEANTNVQYILNPYFVAVYCTFHLTKVSKSITQEMQSMLSKCNHEQYETSKRIKKLGSTFLNAQQMSIQQAVHISLSNENNIF